MTSVAPQQPGPTHYDELGVHPGAETAEIRAVYLGLARRHHPDHHADANAGARSAAGSRMARINAAWAVLSDDAARQAYDRSIGIGGHQGGGSARVRLAGDTWTPLHDADGDIDPSLVDDTPTGSANIPRALTFLPAGCGLVAVVTVGIGVLMTAPSIVLVGTALAVVSVVTFVLAPVLAMVNSARGDGQLR